MWERKGSRRLPRFEWAFGGLRKRQGVYGPSPSNGPIDWTRITGQFLALGLSEFALRRAGVLVGLLVSEGVHRFGKPPGLRGTLVHHEPGIKSNAMFFSAMSSWCRATFTGSNPDD
jgi:hypothetical protein